MELSSYQVQRILTKGHIFKHVSFALFITVLRGKYLKDSSKAALQKYTSDVNAFIAKNRHVMQDDIKELQKI